MLLLADENIPRVVVERLRNAGIDAQWIAEQMPAADDEEVLSLATETNRVLLTFDKDFGALVFKSNLPACPRWSDSLPGKYQ